MCGDSRARREFASGIVGPARARKVTRLSSSLCEKTVYHGRSHAPCTEKGNFRHKQGVSPRGRASPGALLAQLFFDGVNENCRRSPGNIVSHRHLATKIAERVTRDRQPHADADGVLRADERLEHLVANIL